MKFKANVGGHAPGHLREAFCDYLDEHQRLHHFTYETFEPICGKEIFYDGEKPILWLIGQLWNCTDILPGGSREFFENYDGLRRNTYAAAARALKTLIGENGMTKRGKHSQGKK